MDPIINRIVTGEPEKKKKEADIHVVLGSFYEPGYNEDKDYAGMKVELASVWDEPVPPAPGLGRLVVILVNGDTRFRAPDNTVYAGRPAKDEGWGKDEVEWIDTNWFEVVDKDSDETVGDIHSDLAEAILAATRYLKGELAERGYTVRTVEPAGLREQVEDIHHGSVPGKDTGEAKDWEKRWIRRSSLDKCAGAFKIDETVRVTADISGEIYDAELKSWEPWTSSRGQKGHIISSGALESVVRLDDRRRVTLHNEALESLDNIPSESESWEKRWMRRSKKEMDEAEKYFYRFRKFIPRTRSWDVDGLEQTIADLAAKVWKNEGEEDNLYNRVEQLRHDVREMPWNQRIEVGKSYFNRLYGKDVKFKGPEDYRRELEEGIKREGQYSVSSPKTPRMQEHHKKMEKDLLKTPKIKQAMAETMRGFGVGDTVTWIWADKGVTGEITKFTDESDCSCSDESVGVNLKGSDGINYNVGLSEIKKASMGFHGADIIVSAEEAEGVKEEEPAPVEGYQKLKEVYDKVYELNEDLENDFHEGAHGRDYRRESGHGYYEFDIKMRGMPGIEWLNDLENQNDFDRWYWEELGAQVRFFVEQLQEDHPEIKDWYQVGRSGGWLVLKVERENPEGWLSDWDIVDSEEKFRRYAGDQDDVNAAVVEGRNLIEDMEELYNFLRTIETKIDRAQRSMGTDMADIQYWIDLGFEPEWKEGSEYYKPSEAEQKGKDWEKRWQRRGSLEKQAKVYYFYANQAQDGKHVVFKVDIGSEDLSGGEVEGKAKVMAKDMGLTLAGGMTYDLDAERLENEYIVHDATSITPEQVAELEQQEEQATVQRLQQQHEERHRGLLAYWDVDDFNDAEIKYITEEGILEKDYIFGDNEQVQDIYEKANKIKDFKKSIAWFWKEIERAGLTKWLKEKIEDSVYEDTDIYDIWADSFYENLTSVLNEKNPNSDYWFSAESEEDLKQMIDYATREEDDSEALKFESGQDLVSKLRVGNDNEDIYVYDYPKYPGGLKVVTHYRTYYMAPENTLARVPSEAEKWEQRWMRRSSLNKKAYTVDTEKEVIGPFWEKDDFIDWMNGVVDAEISDADYEDWLKYWNNEANWEGQDWSNQVADIFSQWWIKRKMEAPDKKKGEDWEKRWMKRSYLLKGAYRIDSTKELIPMWWKKDDFLEGLTAIEEDNLTAQNFPDAAWKGFLAYFDSSQGIEGEFIRDELTDMFESWWGENKGKYGLGEEGKKSKDWEKRWTRRSNLKKKAVEEDEPVDGYGAPIKKGDKVSFIESNDLYDTDAVGIITGIEKTDEFEPDAPAWNVWVDFDGDVEGWWSFKLTKVTPAVDIKTKKWEQRWQRRSSLGDDIKVIIEDAVNKDQAEMKAIDRLQPIPYLWYENEDGEKYSLSEDELKNVIIPEDYPYQHSRFPVVRDSICVENAPELMSGETGFDGMESVIMYLVTHNNWRLTDAILVAATACERCMNILLEDAGGDVYDQEQRGSAGTHCELCAVVDPEYDAHYKKYEPKDDAEMVKESSVKNSICPKCNAAMVYDDGRDAYVCRDCGYVGPNGPAQKIAILCEYHIPIIEKIGKIMIREKISA